MTQLSSAEQALLSVDEHVEDADRGFADFADEVTSAPGRLAEGASIQGGDGVHIVDGHRSEQEFVWHVPWMR